MKMGGREFFQQATLRLCSSLEIKKAMLNCLSYLRNYLPVSKMLLLIFDPNMGLIQNLATVDLAGIIKTIPPKFLSKKATNHIKLSTSTWQDVKILDNLELHPAGWILSDYVNLSTTSCIYINLVIEGNHLGTVVFLADGKGIFKKSHATLIAQLREPFNIAVSNALRYREIVKLKEIVDNENLELTQELRYIKEDEIIGLDCGLKEVMEMVRQVASLKSPVLLLGETGVGKEVIANAIHYASPRREMPLVKVNCGAIPESLMDSELFGHERGAFTGAIAQKKGRFERADKGSIFLDEIAELPLSAQVRLLRVLQNGEIERVGGTQTIPVDIRIIAATHRNLEEMVRAGKFREDLWFRLNIFPIMIPPLRQRPMDILPLISHFMEKKSKELKIHTPPPMSSATLERLKNYHWPGNVRELENLVERELIKSRGPTGNCFLTFEHFQWPKNSPGVWKSQEGNIPLITLEDVISQHIRWALGQTKGKIFGFDGAASLLGINPNTLRSRMRKLGVTDSHKN